MALLTLMLSLQVDSTLISFDVGDEEESRNSFLLGDVGAGVDEWRKTREQVDSNASC